LATTGSQSQSDASHSGTAIQKLLAKLIRNKREAVSENLSQVTGVHVSVAMLNSFTRTDKGVRLPAILLRPLCDFFDDDRLLLLLMRPHLRKFLALGQAAAEILDERAQKQLMAASTELQAGKKSKRPKRVACAR